MAHPLLPTIPAPSFKRQPKPDEVDVYLKEVVRTLLPNPTGKEKIFAEHGVIEQPENPPTWEGHPTFAFSGLVLSDWRADATVEHEGGSWIVFANRVIDVWGPLEPWGVHWANVVILVPAASTPG